MYRRALLLVFLSISFVGCLSGWNGSPAHAKRILGSERGSVGSFSDALLLIPSTQGDVREMMGRLLLKVKKSDIPMMLQAAGHPNWRMRFWALVGIAKLGPDAKEAIPTVTRLLADRDSDVRATAVFTLGCLEPKSKSAIFALRKRVADQDAQVSYLALKALQQLDGFQDQEGVQILIAELSRSRSNTQPVVRELLEGRIRPEHVESLVNRINTQPNSTERTRLFTLLQQLGPKAKKAIPALAKYINSQTYPDRNAIRALGSVGVGDEKAIAALNQFLRRNLQRTRSSTSSSYYYNLEAALDALSETGPKSKVALQGMLEALRIREPSRISRYIRVRIAAAKALGALGAEAKNAAATIKQGLLRGSFNYSNGNQKVRKALVLISPDDLQAFESYVSGLRSDANRKTDLEQTLKQVAPRLVPRLLKDLRSSNAYTRRKAFSLFSKLGPLAKTAVPTLKEYLANKDTPLAVRQQAARVLQEIGPAAEPAIPQLIAAMKYPDVQVQVAAAMALGNIGKEPEKTVPALLAAMKVDDKRVPTAAAEALGAFPSQSKKIVPALLEALKENVPSLQLAAVKSLGQIETLGKEAVPPLVGLWTRAGTNSTTTLESARVISQITKRLNYTPPEVLKAMNSQQPDSMQHRLTAIALGGQNKKSVDVLRKLVRETKSPTIRWDALDSLAGMGEPGQAAEPELLDALRDPSSQTRRKAARALSKLLGTEAKRANAYWVETLLKNASNSNPANGVREVALLQEVDSKSSDFFYANLAEAYEGILRFDQQVTSLKQSLRSPNPSSYTYYRLGYLYYQKLEYRKSAPLFRNAAQKGYASGQYYLGRQYFQGLSVRQDQKEAVMWYTRAAKQNHSSAMNSLGFAYHQGAGVAKDLKEAVNWFQRSARYGNKVAQYNMGIMYRTGQGVPKNYSSALNYFRQSAGQRYAKAENLLGEMYRLGHGTSKSYPTATTWYRRAALQGYPVGQYNLGRMYYNGWGTTRDYKKAFQWFARAANQGYPTAQSLVARMYSRGQAVKRDYSKALLLYRKAASSGDPRFLNALAYFRATCPDGQFRDGKEAVTLALKACKKTKFGDPAMLDTLAAAYAEMGDFKNAVKTQQQAIKHPKAQSNTTLLQAMRERLKLYQNQKPYRFPGEPRVEG